MSRHTVGNTIRALRELRGLSRRALATSAKCSQPTIYRIENDEQDPSLSLLRDLLDALEADDRTRLDLLKTPAV